MKNDAYFTRYHEHFVHLIESNFESGYFKGFVEKTQNFCLLRAESVRGQLDGIIPSTIAAQAKDKSTFVDASEIWLPDMGEIVDLKDGYH